MMNIESNHNEPGILHIYKIFTFTLVKWKIFTLELAILKTETFSRRNYHLVPSYNVLNLELYIELQTYKK
jgi:hypothetical protein